MILINIVGFHNTYTFFRLASLFFFFFLAGGGGGRRGVQLAFSGLPGQGRGGAAGPPPARRRAAEDACRSSSHSARLRRPASLFLILILFGSSDR